MENFLFKQLMCIKMFKNYPDYETWSFTAAIKRHAIRPDNLRLHSTSNIHTLTI
jgi:hypothetical protein